MDYLWIIEHNRLVLVLVWEDFGFLHMWQVLLFVTSNRFHTSSILVLSLFAWYMGGINLVFV